MIEVFILSLWSADHFLAYVCITGKAPVIIYSNKDQNNADVCFMLKRKSGFECEPNNYTCMEEGEPVDKANSISMWWATHR